MTPTDEQELLRLTNLLKALHERPDVDRQCREVLQKAALALSERRVHHGLRPEMERLYATLADRCLRLSANISFGSGLTRMLILTSRLQIDAAASKRLSRIDNATFILEPMPWYD